MPKPRFCTEWLNFLWWLMSMIAWRSANGNEFHCPDIPSTTSMDHNSSWGAYFCYLVIAYRTTNFMAACQTQQLDPCRHGACSNSICPSTSKHPMRRLLFRFSDHIYILISHRFYACYMPCSNLTEMTNKMQLCRTIYCSIFPWLLNIFQRYYRSSSGASKL